MKCLIHIQNLAHTYKCITKILHLISKLLKYNSHTYADKSYKVEHMDHSVGSQPFNLVNLPSKNMHYFTPFNTHNSSSQADPPKLKINKVTSSRQNTTKYIISH